MTDPRDPVEDAARAIASGEAVDWGAVDSSASDDAARDLARQLHVVADIAAFHSNLYVGAATAAAPLLADGSTWGALTIRGFIGRGACGQVYRAWDPRLDREVALKVITGGDSPASAVDAVVIEEGRVLARLRHPNIVAIHGADRIDGRVGLVMELIAGRSVDQIIRAQGPFSAEEASLIGRDVCRALAAIHGAGLVHRDVKAQNVMREAGGRHVLMDLGAGRAAGDLAPGDLSGTPLYLAPEVLTGAAATPRSDVYSLGVLLYFCVTGTFPVRASRLDELRAAHRAVRRVRLRDARPDLPERFIHVVERALSADPAQRFDSAGSCEAALSETFGPAAPVRSKNDRSRRWFAVAMVGVIALVIVLVWLARQPAVPLPEPAAFRIPLDASLTRPTPPGAAEFAISPDGTTLVYATTALGRGQRIYRRALGEFDNTLLRTVDAGQPFFSPDGRWVGLNQQNSPNKLVKLALDGSAMIVLADWADPAGGTWDRDGTIVFSSNGDLWRVADTPGGNVSRLTSVDRGRGERAIRPHVLPTGAILFTLRRNGRDSVAVLDRGGTPRPILDDGHTPKYLPPGYLVYVNGASVMAAPFDVRSAVVTGSPVVMQPIDADGVIDVSATGIFVYGSHVRTAAPQFVWVDRASGRETPVPFPADRLVRLLDNRGRLSPDGRHVAVTIAGGSSPSSGESSTESRVVIGDLDRATLATLSDESVTAIGWGPEAGRFTYRKPDGTIAARSIDGAGTEDILARDAAVRTCANGDWSPNGRTLLLTCLGQLFDLLALSLPGSPTSAAPLVETFLATPFGEGSPRFSPDGHCVAYQSTEGGVREAREIYIRPFPGREPRTPVTRAGGMEPVWRGDELFYYQYDPPMPMVVHVEETQNACRVSAPRPAVSGTSAVAGRFDVSPDGLRLLIVRGDAALSQTELRVIVHWNGEVARKMPPGK